MADIEHKLKIQFDGLDAANHEIELFSLGESLKGLARIASVVGNFATTEKYSKRFSCHDVRVVAREPKANCFSFEILWSFVQQHQILSGSFGAVVSALIPYILARTANKREEMNILKETIDKLITSMSHNNEYSIDRLSRLIEKMALDLQPSARAVVTPIGESCKTMSLISAERKSVFDELDKAEIMKSASDEITEIRSFEVLITELDIERGSCKVHIVGDGDETRRVNALVTDPEISLPNNVYSLSMARNESLAVKAKAVLREGDIQKLFISDHGI